MAKSDGFLEFLGNHIISRFQKFFRFSNKILGDPQFFLVKQLACILGSEMEYLFTVPCGKEIDFLKIFCLAILAAGHDTVRDSEAYISSNNWSNRLLYADELACP